MPSTRKDNNGFTIIETIIAVGVGGFIITLVFLAIPALMRTSQNNQRTQDVTTILQAVSNYRLRNLGGFPASATTDSTNTDNTKVLLAGGYKLTYYDAGNVKFSDSGYSIDNDSVNVKQYLKCDGNSYITNGAGSRDIAALYSIKTGSGYADKCMSL